MPASICSKHSKTVDQRIIFAHLKCFRRSEKKKKVEQIAIKSFISDKMLEHNQRVTLDLGGHSDMLLGLPSAVGEWQDLIILVGRHLIYASFAALRAI